MNEPQKETRPHIGMDQEEPTIAEAAEAAAQGDLLTEHPPAQQLAPATGQEVRIVNATPLAMLASALEAGHDITKLEKLMDMAERYEANEARKAFAAALSDFQGLVPAIVETKLATVTMQSGGSYTYSYADLDIIMKAIRPHLKATGLSVRYDAEVSDDGARIRSTCYVMHRDGHTEKTTFVVPLDEAMKVNDSQKMGSANSYACRYNVVNALGLTTGEDDDGHSLHSDKRETGENIRGSAPEPAKKDDVDEFFPIGKHKGKPWDQVPLDYLEWVVANLTDKPDIVKRARQQIDARLDSDDQPPAEPGEPTMAECAKWITDATHSDKLAELWEMVPDKHREGLKGFHETRRQELLGNDKRKPQTGDDNPF